MTAVLEPGQDTNSWDIPERERVRTLEEASRRVSEVRDKLQSEVLEAIVRGNRAAPLGTRVHVRLDDAVYTMLDILDDLLDISLVVGEAAYQQR